MDLADLKLVLVHDWLTGLRGGEKCLAAICRHFPSAPLFTLLYAPRSTTPIIEERPIQTSFLQQLPGARRHYRYLLPLMPSAADGLVIPRDVDLVLSFSHAVAKGVRVPPGVPHVCYCFTPMRYAWHARDDYFSGEPPRGGLARRVRGGIAAARNAVLDWVQDWDRAVSDRVTHFIACSRTVAERIRQCYQRDSRVIYPPVDVEFFTPTNQLREDFYLCVSALAPYKRIDLAIAACRRLGRPLVIIGQGPHRRRLARLAGPNVEFLGWQPDEVVRDYLRRCRALLFPGHEDFGIVPVEAQACGAPVIAYGRGGATETLIPPTSAAPGTGLFFEEQTVDSLCDGIRNFEVRPEALCPALARRNAEQFNSARYELAMLEVIASRGGNLLSEQGHRSQT
jgi:glycosyltransferase involved in cell wall biosynthesis